MFLFLACGQAFGTEAERALGQVKGVEAVERLVPRLSSEKTVARRRAAVALASALKDPEIEDPAGLLAESVVGLGPVGQMEVLRIMDRLNPPRAALRGLLRMLSSGRLPTSVARECIKRVGGIRYAGLDAAYEGLRDSLDDEDPLVRGEAAVVLARMRLSEDQREEIVPGLLKQLGDDTGRGQAFTAKALARVTGEGEGRNAYGWRVWGVQQGYEDLGRLEPAEDYEPPAPVVPAGRTLGAHGPWGSWWPYAIVAVGLFGAGAALLARVHRSRRLAAKLESKRRKIRRTS